VPVFALAALVVAGCAGPSVSDDGEATPDDLEISVTVGDGPTKLWTLQCSPPGGTLPKPAHACARLERLKNPFAPVPRNVACTEVYGGPQVADVRGRFRGRRLSAHFSRIDGCEIARWDRVRFLFPDT